jgi:hypothetical protein
MSWNIDVVAKQQDEALVRGFGHGSPPRTPRARRFSAELVGTVEANMDVRGMEGYEPVRAAIRRRLGR